MEFALSEEQVLLKDNVDRLLAEQAPLERIRSYADGSEPGIAHMLWHQLCDLGIGLLLIPEAADGLGLTVLDAALVAESLGSAVAPAPVLGSGIVAPYLLAEVPDAGDALAALAAGELRVGLALSELAGAREDSGVVAHNGKLNGRSLHVLDFDEQSAYLVADGKRQLYLVDPQAAGLSGRSLTTIDRTRATGELSFSDTPARLLTTDPDLCARTLALARIALAADSLGAASTMLSAAVEYAKQREQFNRPIASFQAVKHMCAEMAAALEPCRAMVWYAAHKLDEREADAVMMACHTKAHIADVGKRLAKTATEVHGGMGFTDLLGLHYWFKRIGFNRQTLGTPAQLRREAAIAQGFIDNTAQNSATA
ncbi:MAG: acyl-CoA dehydrogenase family protein [Pseudomonadota bacterium]